MAVGGRAGERVSALVTIHVRDVNDNSPVFTRSRHMVTWHVAMATDRALAVVKATDMDSGICGRVLYAIVAGNQQRMFHIDAESGLCRPSASMPMTRIDK